MVGTQVPKPSPAFRLLVSSQPEAEAEQRLKARHPDMGCMHPRHSFTTVPKLTPFPALMLLFAQGFSPGCVADGLLACGSMAGCNLSFLTLLLVQGRQWITMGSKDQGGRMVSIPSQSRLQTGSSNIPSHDGSSLGLRDAAWLRRHEETGSSGGLDSCGLHCGTETYQQHEHTTPQAVPPFHHLLDEQLLLQDIALETE